MIDKLIDKYNKITNKKQLEELTKERDKYKELLLFNLETTDELAENITEIIESDMLYTDQKIIIKELLSAFKQKKL